MNKKRRKFMTNKHINNQKAISNNGIKSEKKSNDLKEKNESNILIKTDDTVPLEVRLIILNLEKQTKQYRISLGISIVVVLGLICFLFNSDEKFKSDTLISIILLVVFLFVLFIFFAIIIYNYIKILEISKKKTELIELNTILKSVHENRRQNFLLAYLKKNIFKDE